MSGSFHHKPKASQGKHKMSPNSQPSLLIAPALRSAVLSISNWICGEYREALIIQQLGCWGILYYKRITTPDLVEIISAPILDRGMHRRRHCLMCFGNCRVAPARDSVAEGLSVTHKILGFRGLGGLGGLGGVRYDERKVNHTTLAINPHIQTAATHVSFDR